MAAHCGPNLVKNGLILDLDIANRKSYLDAVNTSLISTSSWADGQTGSVTGYTANETVSTENARVLATDPWGNSNVVWETRASGDGNNDGGWNSNYYSVDRTKLYRFSIWMRRTSSTSGGTFYFGLYGNTGIARLDTGATEFNPYWDCSSPSAYTQNEWYLFVAHCYPFGTTFTGRHPDSGYYTTTGVKSNWNACNIGGDVKMLSDTTQLLHRAYHFYCGDNTTRLQFAYPRIDLCDGNQPSIGELITNSPSMLRDTSGYNNHHFIKGYYIPNSELPRRFTLNGSTQGFTRASALNGATTTCTVVVYYKTTDTQELWVQGNQNGAYYLSASYGNNYYHGNCGAPTNYIDLQTVVNPATPINYRDGTYRMWEAKGVDFSGWTYFDWFLYGGGWQLSGDVCKIMVYNRVITDAESKQNFNALRGRFGI
jgi:hypothetical protein